MKPSPHATYERARRLANVACFTVALQRRRLMTSEPEDGEFRFRRWADFQFLIVALTRLRRAAALAAKVPEIKAPISAAVKAFDASMPDLKIMRDVAEHIDEYAIDEGRKSTKPGGNRSGVRRQALEVAFVGKRQVQWLGFSLDTEQALQASEALFRAIKSNVPSKAKVI